MICFALLVAREIRGPRAVHYYYYYYYYKLCSQIEVPEHSDCRLVPY